MASTSATSSSSTPPSSNAATTTSPRLPIIIGAPALGGVASNQSTPSSSPYPDSSAVNHLYQLEVSYLICMWPITINTNGSFYFHQSHTFKALVEKRTMNLDYIRQVHKGGAYWLNTSLISKQRLLTYIEYEVRWCYCYCCFLHTIILLKAKLRYLRPYPLTCIIMMDQHTGTQDASFAFFPSRSFFS